MYDMDMRQYDPAIARWIVQDPIVHHGMSPYNAFDNNPVLWADPSGADSWQYDWDANNGTYKNSKGETTKDWQKAVSETTGENNGDGKEENKDGNDDKKNEENKKIIGKKEKEEQDNNYNFFYKTKDSHNRFLSENINDGGASKTTIAVNTHANSKGEKISSPYGWMNAYQLHIFLYNNNDLYKDSYDNKKEINVNIVACNAGKDIVEKLSTYNPYAKFTGPTSQIKMYLGSNILVDENAEWVTYQNGIKK